MKARIQKLSFLQFVIVLLLVAILPILLIIVGQRQELQQKAAPATTLTFSPVTLTEAPGDRFPIDIMVQTNENLISAAKLVVTFDQTKLSAESIVASDYLPVILETGSVGPGLAKITIGSSPTQPRKGTGRLAEITFKAKGPTGVTQVTFGDDTEIAGINEKTNVVIGKGSATVTIATAGQTKQVFPTSTPASPAGRPLPPPQVFNPTTPPTSGQTGFGKLASGEIPAPLITPIKEPAPIKDPLVIAYLKVVLEFIRGIFGK